MLSLGVLLVSSALLLVPVGLALYLVSRYTSQFSKLPAGSRAAYPVVIAIVLLPVAWPYAERLVAQHRCADFQKLDQFSVFRTESIRLEFQGDGDIFTPHYLLIDTAGNSEWIFKNNVRSIVSENGTTEFTRHASGEKCDSATSGDPYGRDLCRKSTNETNSPANLKVIFKTAAGADKKGSTTEVSFLDAQSNGKVATFHSFRWFPSFGSFALGSDLPLTCGDRHEFSKFFQQVLGN